VDTRRSREDSESLGEPVEAKSDEAEEEDAQQGTWPKSAERYTPSSIEQLTPQMREELMVRLLVRGMNAC